MRPDHAKVLGMTYLLMTIWPRCGLVSNSNSICFCCLVYWSKTWGAYFVMVSQCCTVYSTQVVSVYQRGRKTNRFTTQQFLKPERGRLVPAVHFDTYSPMLMTLLSLQVSHRLQYLSFATTPCHAWKRLSAEAGWHFETISPRLFCPSLRLHAMKMHTLRQRKHKIPNP